MNYLRYVALSYHAVVNIFHESLFHPLFALGLLHTGSEQFSTKCFRSTETAGPRTEAIDFGTSIDTRGAGKTRKNQDGQARKRPNVTLPKAVAVENGIVSMAMQGKLPGRINEGKLIEMLERGVRVAGQQEPGQKISIQRKRYAFDSDDDDDDDDEDLL
eukprot:scaffold10571_cov154-Cylindrotheca_fusiformis.AAC.9